MENLKIITKAEEWSKYAKIYDPVKVGSIDGTDTEPPHDKAVIRAKNSKYIPPQSHEKYGDPKRTIFIGRLNPKTDEEELMKRFKKFGTIENSRVVCDLVTGTSKCYAFVEFKHRASAKDAVYEMNEKVIDNCQILVDYECERSLKGWKPRRLGGGFGGKKESGQLRFGCIDRPFRRPFDTNISVRDAFRQHKLKKR